MCVYQLMNAGRGGMLGRECNCVFVTVGQVFSVLRKVQERVHIIQPFYKWEVQDACPQKNSTLNTKSLYFIPLQLS